MTNFYSHLSYSIGNEDWETEQLALQIKPTDKVVCITASGDRPLNLLMSDCAEITSIDANPVQTYLLELKMAALKHLEYDDYLQFLGLKPSSVSRVLSEPLTSELSPEAQKYWQAHHSMIEKGVLFQGAVERVCYYAAKLLRFLIGKKLEKLTKFDNLEEQKEFVKKYWDTFLCRKLLDWGVHPSVSQWFIDDPGLSTFIDKKFHPGKYIYERMTNYLYSNLAKNSLLFSLVVDGRPSEDALGPWLQKDGVETIRPRLSKINSKVGNIIDYLESVEEGSIDCFSFSDIASYMDSQSFERMLRATLRAAKPGARFCIREFLSAHTLSPDIAPFFKRNNVLEKDLESKEGCFIYRFMTGEIDLDASTQQQALGF